MRSSYIENDYGNLLKTYVISWQPRIFVELGVLDGYSTLAIASGIKELTRLRGPQSKLDAYDLFEDYQYKHGSQENVQKEIDNAGLTEHVNLVKGDAYKVYDKYGDKSVEFLHVDISNTGEVIHNIMEVWHPKIGPRGLVLFEGGSEERDNIEWMKKFNMPPIKKEMDSNPIITKNYIIGTYFPFPSMTVLLRNWW